MRKYIRLFFKTLKVFILFTGCTIFFYYAIMWVKEEYENYHRYDEPEGKAIEVFSYDDGGDFGGFKGYYCFIWMGSNVSE